MKEQPLEPREPREKPERDEMEAGKDKEVEADFTEFVNTNPRPLILLG